MAAIVRRRFTAVLFLSVVGYGMAALFVVQGAPDLALTQAAIETLSTVLFVLVLRTLPDRFERRSSPLHAQRPRGDLGRRWRCWSSRSRSSPRGRARPTPVSTEMIERSLPDGQGRNVVNVILVDFRGFDTMGELTVLAAAAIGCVALGARRVAARGRPAVAVAAGHGQASDGGPS